jgi:hypothetical protein
MELIRNILNEMTWNEMEEFAECLNRWWSNDEFAADEELTGKFFATWAKEVEFEDET